MLETSKDLLYVALAFCFVWLTVFLSWLLYYLIAIVRDVSRLTGQVRQVIERVDALTRAIHEKFESGVASFGLAASAVKEIVGWAIRERSAKAERSRREKDEEAE